ncbi:MAG: GNAT family N-acetyltransferase [Flavobacteriaceae bacterium]|nr:GNAT family N-acetyltransferase [Flavobacteriaceae bacterium]
MKIIKATHENLTTLAPLFDGYRIFYKQNSDREAAQDFLSKRFAEGDSVIFMAVDEQGNGLGFTQLYPSFSSVFMQRVYILNDLFVDAHARGKGVGEALMEHAKVFAREQGAKGLTLETAVDNPAQKLYERLGWKKDTEVFHYTWEA